MRLTNGRHIPIWDVFLNMEAPAQGADAQTPVPISTVQVSAASSVPAGAGNGGASRVAAPLLAAFGAALVVRGPGRRRRGRRRAARATAARTGLFLIPVLFLWPQAADAQSGQVVEYYHTDALGSVRAVTQVVNGQTQVVSRHDFMPFGEEVNPPSPPAEKRLFTGQERDFETGLDYFNARYLATGHGRFTTIDPLGHGYMYAANNPLRFVDPTGLAEQDRLYNQMDSGSFAPTDAPWGEDNPDLDYVFELTNAVAEARALRAALVFAVLWANYPGHDIYPTDPSAVGSIWSLIGGHVEMNEWTRDADGSLVPSNSCAVRMSYALNHSGLNIPKGKGTVSGADGKQYFLRVADLQNFLSRALGPPQRLSGGTFDGPRGSSGILSFNIRFRAGDATGHFTLWNGSGVVDPREPYWRWPQPTSILFWGVR